LAIFVKAKYDAGLSYADMAREAGKKGFDVTGQAFSDVVAETHKRPLRADAVEWLAAGIGETPKRVRDLDLQWWREEAERVSDDPVDVIRHQRPPDLTDVQWEAIKAASEGTVRALIRQYRQGR
jgi:citrate lyase beta subunit